MKQIITCASALQIRLQQLKSLTNNRDNARRTAAAERSLEAAKLAVEKYGDDMGYKEETKAVLKEVSAGIRDDQTFLLDLSQADKTLRSKSVYTDLGG